MRPRERYEGGRSATGSSEELSRAIARQYSRRDEDDWVYSPLTAHYTPIRQDTERNLDACIRHFCRMRGVGPASWRAELRTLRVLDVGCGDGWVLGHLVSLQLDPANLFGIELREQVAARAVASLPAAVTIRTENFLEHRGGNYDLVTFFTVFSSLLDPAHREEMARGALERLAPRGAVLVFDFVFDNPRNPDVRKVTRAEIERYFPGCEILERSAYLAPPLARRICRLSPRLYDIFNVPFLRTHRFWLITPRAQREVRR